MVKACKLVAPEIVISSPEADFRRKRDAVATNYIRETYVSVPYFAPEYALSQFYLKKRWAEIGSTGVY